MMQPESDAVTRMAKRLAALDPHLDDLTRQRVLTRIHASIEAEGRRPLARARVWSALLAAAAAAFVLGWGLLAPRRAPVARRAAPTQVRTAPEAVSAPALARLVPYLVSGSDAARARELLGVAAGRLELDAGEQVLVALGERARLRLEGPATLSILRSSSERVELELERGVLLVDYDHSRGGELAIRSPQALTEVVGTLFSVRVDAGTSRIGVARGALRVRTAERVVALGAAQAFQAAAAMPEPLAAKDDAALQAHARSLAPPSGNHGVLGVTGPRLLAELEGQLLAETPLWALLPVGSNTITLRDSAQRERRVHAAVRSSESTELVLASQPDRPAPQPARAAAVPPASTPVSPSAEELYRAAEAAMRAANGQQASELLAELVRAHPQAPEVDVALYELAQSAFREADYGRAQTWLAELDQKGARAALRDPAHYLRCRIAQARAQATAYEACLQQFHASFPDSPHSAEVRATLAVLRFDREGCAAKALLDRYLADHPRGPFANAIRARRQRCAP
jgi:hypothetical protein